MIAYELARQLQESGESVRSLVMLDTLDGSGMKNMSAGLDGSISAKNTMLAATNFMLMSEGMLRQGSAPDLIHPAELDLALEDDAFLEELVRLTHARGSQKSPERLRADLARQVGVLLGFVDAQQEPPAALPDPASVECVYVRNASGVFYGDHEEYFTLTPRAGGVLTIPSTGTSGRHCCPGSGLSTSTRTVTWGS